MSDRDTIERAIRHIDSCLDVDPWARDIAIDAMKRLLEQASYRQVTGKLDDTISRQAAIGAVENCERGEELFMIKNLPSVQPEPSEITDEQAILHLQSTGWMQNHDREMYESGLREQLADDSGSYDSIISCKDAIVRLPSAQPEPREVVPHRTYKKYQYLSDYWCECGRYLGKKGDVTYCPDCGRKVIWNE